MIAWIVAWVLYIALVSIEYVLLISLAPQQVKETGRSEDELTNFELAIVCVALAIVLLISIGEFYGTLLKT